MCYLDDIVIYGKTSHKHNQRLEVILNCLQRKGLILNSKKCHFGKRQMLVLGFFVEKEGILPDPQKLAAVRNFEQPKLKDLRCFLGLCSYFRRFIKDFARLAHLLTSLLHKDMPFAWTAECESAFNELKILLSFFLQ